MIKKPLEGGLLSLPTHTNVKKGIQQLRKIKFYSPSKGCHLVCRVGREDGPLDMERYLDRHPEAFPLCLSLVSIALHICKDFSMILVLDEIFVHFV